VKLHTIDTKHRSYIHITSYYYKIWQYGCAITNFIWWPLGPQGARRFTGAAPVRLRIAPEAQIPKFCFRKVLSVKTGTTFVEKDQQSA